MTALCGGGASSVKAGIGNTVVVSAGLISGGLTLISPWLIPVAALVDGFIYNALSNCGVDPPAMPTWTVTDLTNLVGGVLNPSYQTSLQKLSDTVMHYLWYQFCDCNGTPPTIAFVPPAQPPSLTVPGPSNAAPCFNGSWSGTVEDYSANPVFHTNKRTLCYPGSDANQTLGGNVINVRQPNVPLPSGYNGTISVTFADAFAHTVEVFVEWWDGAGAFLQNGLVAVPTVANGVSTVQFSGVVPATAKWLYVDVLDVAAAYHASTAVAQLSWQCSGQAVGQPSTPCVTDPSVMALLQMIWDMVRLLQRQLVPFAYISSTAHAGLTGQGTIAVQGLLGLRIDLTTMPASLTQDASTPPFVFNVGWVSMEDANGFIDETRAHAQHQNWFSRIASEATLIGYSFAPGVVATITELQREP